MELIIKWEMIAIPAKRWALWISRPLRASRLDLLKNSRLINLLIADPLCAMRIISISSQNNLNSGRRNSAQSPILGKIDHPFSSSQESFMMGNGWANLEMAMEFKFGLMGQSMKGNG